MLLLMTEMCSKPRLAMHLAQQHNCGTQQRDASATILSRLGSAVSLGVVTVLSPGIHSMTSGLHARKALTIL